MVEHARRPDSRAERRRRDGAAPAGIERRGAEVRPVVVNWRSEPDGIVVTIENALVVGNCFAVRDQLAGYIRKFTARKIILDLAGVPFADSVAMGMLAELRAMSLQAGKRLVARNPVEHVRTVMEMLDLDRHLLVE